MEERRNAGSRFLPNGDLLVSHHLPGHRILVRIIGFRGPEWFMPRQKVVIDSYVLECHACCGCPIQSEQGHQGHAYACKRK